MPGVRAIEDICSCLEVLPYGAKATQHYGAARANQVLV